MDSIDLNTLITDLKVDEYRISVIAGAGISAASGVPTFRGEDGLWKNYDPMQLATPQAFRKDPKLVWEWYKWRIKKVQSCEPNAAHFALVQLEEHELLQGIITQNVDGLHIRAGNSHKKVVTIHGDLFGARCTNESCSEYVWWTEDKIKMFTEAIPRCKACDAYLRPDVVWFGEGLNPQKLEKARQILENSTILFIIGTSGHVQPVASLPYYFRSHHSSSLILEFNVETTPLSSLSDKTILGSAAETVPDITRRIISKFK